MSAYRLVALDVDGTLLQRGRPLSEPVKAAIGEAAARGTIVTLASGRMFPLLRPLVDQLGLSAPVVCYGGAMVVEPVSAAPLYQRGVPLELAREVVRAARERRFSPRVYLGERVYVDRLDPAGFNYESLLRTKATAVGDLLDFLQEDPSHLAIDAPAERTRALVREMRVVFGGRLNVTTGHPLLTEFTHPSVNKGTAVAWLANRLGIGRAEVLAIGDDWNDLELLRYAGLGVAVANAHPDVLAAAAAIVPSCADDGVAEALRRYVLAG